jgi:hypothetical protein
MFINIMLVKSQNLIKMDVVQSETHKSIAIGLKKTKGRLKNIFLFIVAVCLYTIKIILQKSNF